MLGRDSTNEESAEYTPAPSGALKAAVRQARIESAERSGVVVDLRDAEIARLELLNEALDPVFAEIPAEIDLFDRGITRGDVPRLWIDAVAHVAMGRDKRKYRFVQDGRYGRKILAESFDIDEMVQAIMHYLANRIVEREHALSEKFVPTPAPSYLTLSGIRSHRRWRMLRMFIYGLIVGSLALFAALWLAAWNA
jgi:hypothetical protein